MRKYIAVLGIVLFGFGCQETPKAPEKTESPQVVQVLHKAPDTLDIPKDKTGDMIRYGRTLIQNFPEYLGPQGTIGKYGGNGLSCQNCHLEAGTRPYGFNFFSTHARYPQYRAREGKLLSLADRVNNCIERPLNGKPMPHDHPEMIAILAYLKWVSQGVPVDARVEGDNQIEIKLPNRAVDLENGKKVYNQHCLRCHGADGEGVLNPDKYTYQYPPLWGKKSYQPGSSMHRLIKAAQFIKANMPNDLAKWDKPVLTDEEAYDVAAFVNNDEAHPRPFTELADDYPVIEEKPIDFCKGPYADPFPEMQHKFGPFQPIIEWRKKNGQKTGY